MNTPIQLYFDHVDDDGSRGVTHNGEKILYNLNKISESYFKEYTDALAQHNNATIFVPTGRFLSDIRLSFDTREQAMATFDLRNSMSFAESVAPKESPYFEAFMKGFTLMEAKYSVEFDKFILIQGDLPISDEESTQKKE